MSLIGADGFAVGDFNYDGVIDGGDDGITDNNIRAQGPPIQHGFASFTAMRVTACRGRRLRSRFLRWPPEHRCCGAGASWYDFSPNQERAAIP